MEVPILRQSSDSEDKSKGYHPVIVNSTQYYSVLDSEFSVVAMEIKENQ